MSEVKSLFLVDERFLSKKQNKFVCNEYASFGITHMVLRYFIFLLKNRSFAKKRQEVIFVSN